MQLFLNIVLGTAVISLGISMFFLTRIVQTHSARIYQLERHNSDISWRIYRALSTHGNVPLPTFEVWNKSISRSD